MSFLQTDRRGRSQTLRYLVAWLCVLLILFAGTAQALHTHAPDEAVNAGCSLCAVAHANPLPTPVLASLVVAEAILPIAAREASAPPNRTFFFSLSIRPPPVLTAHA